MKTEVQIAAGGAILPGTLTLPEGCFGLVLFAHGSGSSRFSLRNRFVAGKLNERGLATLLFDLLTEEESLIDQKTAEYRFAIELLAQRLIAAVDWACRQLEFKALPIGLFGASTGAAAALIAAAHRPKVVKAVVSRGGRPDLAQQALAHVQAPTLLIVGSKDEVVLELNRKAASLLQTHWRLEILEGASHLFEEPGKLEQVAQLAGDWFCRYLSALA